MSDTPDSPATPATQFPSITEGFDAASMAAKHPEKLGLPADSGMHVRKKLRKFPPLREVIKDGFDYQGFCKAVDESEKLTAEGRTLAKDLFNPNKRISGAMMRGGERAFRQYKDMFGGSDEAPADHPIQATWREVWNDTKGRFTKEVADYDAMVAKKNEKRGKTVTADTPQYPHAIPKVIHSKAKIVNAGMMLMGDSPMLLVTDGFLQLPAEQQKAILYHEARHGFEPVTAKVEANKYIWRRLAIQGLTFNASSRHHEHKADENAAAFGHAEALAQSLDHITESTKPAMKEMYGAMGAVAKAATDNGFQIDKKKAIDVISAAQPKPTTLKKQMLAPVVKLGRTVAVSALDRGIRKMANRDAEQLTEEAMNPKLWGIRIGTHPTTAERVAKLLGGGRAL